MTSFFYVASYCHLSATLQTNEYHCWNLQDNRAVVRIFTAVLRFHTHTLYIYIYIHTHTNTHTHTHTHARAYICNVVLYREFLNPEESTAERIASCVAMQQWCPFYGAQSRVNAKLEDRVSQSGSSHRSLGMNRDMSRFHCELYTARHAA